MSADRWKLREDLRQLVDDIEPEADALDVLAAVTDLAQVAALARDRLVYECCQRGDSYAEVARRTGWTREAVRKRFGR